MVRFLAGSPQLTRENQNKYMRYKYTKRNGGYDTVLKWSKPTNHKLELLGIGIATTLVAVITLLASTI